MKTWSKATIKTISWQAIIDYNSDNIDCILANKGKRYIYIYIYIYFCLIFEQSEGVVW